MIYANITNHKINHSGIFNIQIALNQEIDDFLKSDVELTAQSGNGLTGFKIKFMGGGKYYSLQVSPPPATVGAFEVVISRDDIQARARTFRYDTRTEIPVAFGDPVYDSNKITIPITFPEDVIGLSKNSFRIEHDLHGLRCALFGVGQAYQLVLSPHGRGTAEISIVKKVLKANCAAVSVVGSLSLEV